jgi:hypothetical protein
MINISDWSTRDTSRRAKFSTPSTCAVKYEQLKKFKAIFYAKKKKNHTASSK